MAVWRTWASSEPGLPGSTSSKRRTSGPPCSWKRMALGMRALHGSIKDNARSPFVVIRLIRGSLPDFPPTPYSLIHLQRSIIRLTRTNADHALDLGDENLAVADFSRFGGLHDGFNDLVDQVATHSHLDTRLGNEVDHVLGAAV